MTNSDAERLDAAIAELRKETNSNFDTLFMLVREMSNKMSAMATVCPIHEKRLEETSHKLANLNDRVTAIEKLVFLEQHKTEKSNDTLTLINKRLDAIEKTLLIRDTETATAKRTIKWLSGLLYALGGAFGGGAILRILEIMK